jgi:AcrR family transcriptional regulator
MDADQPTGCTGDGQRLDQLATATKSDPLRAINSTLQRDRKSTQRERIVAGMLDAVAANGYAAATIAEAIAAAGVSRPTFYEYFADKSSCFVATVETIQTELLTTAVGALEDGPPERAVFIVVDVLIDFAATRPEPARVLLNEAMGGGAPSLDVRDRGLDALAALVEARHEMTSAAIVPDLPSRPLLGGIYRLLASRLREGEPCGPELRDDLLEWLSRYMARSSDHRWRQLQPIAGLTSPLIVEPPLEPQIRLGRGRTRVSDKELAENYWQRIVSAAARLAIEKGASATTVTDLARGAGIDNRVLYRLFKGKEEIFLALYELLFRRVLGATAAGFHTGETWPEKVWEAARVFARYVQQHPALARASFVDSFACDDKVVQRVEQLVNGFTIFLQEGFQYRPLMDPPSALALQAIAATLFELGYLYTREDRVDELPGLVPHTTFIVIAPFVGVAASNAFIDGRLQEQASSQLRSTEQAQTSTASR